MRKILVVVGLLALSVLGLGTLVDFPAMALSNVCDDPDIAEDLKEAAGCELGSDDNVLNVVVGLIEVALGLFGLIGVGVIVYGALIYATSVGDTGKTAKAKNIILYGIVGLVVSMLAFAVVRFVSVVIGG